MLHGPCGVRWPRTDWRKQPAETPRASAGAAGSGSWSLGLRRRPAAQPTRGPTPGGRASGWTSGARRGSWHGSDAQAPQQPRSRHSGSKPAWQSSVAVRAATGQREGPDSQVPFQRAEQAGADAEATFRALQRTAAAARRAGWRRWVRNAVAKQPRLLYRWLKGTPPLPTAALGADGQWVLDPRALVEQAADAWAKVWTAADQPPEQSQPQHWKPRAPRGLPLPLITGEQVNDVAKRLVAGTAGGGDG